jgi:oligopeptide/dipeptide ABC transporter ATP-binding protein
VPRIPKDGKQQKRYETLKGEIPSPIDLPPGCRFSSRCPLAEAQCRAKEPQLRELSPGHWVSCHLA